MVQNTSLIHLQGVKATRDGGLIIHKDAAVDSVKTPSGLSTVQGAGFGENITDSDRAWAALREPIAHFLTYGVAGDITEKWFSINDPDTEEADPELDRSIQEVLIQLKFKKVLTDAITQSRIYKKALIVCAFNDATNVASLKQPVRKGAELRQLSVYPNTTANGWIMQEKGIESVAERVWSVEQKDEDENSLRYGLPVIYKLNRGTGREIFVHYTRVLEVDNENSVLDSVWDDMTCGRNIRWGAAQWLYRTGGGFPVIGFPHDMPLEKLQAWCDSGAFSNLMNRTYIAIAQNSIQENTGMTFDFKGPSGVSLDPQPFFQSNIEQISIATGIPQPKLIGAQAGAVTGREVNEQGYFKYISKEQSRYEDLIRQLLTLLTDSGQISLLKTATDHKLHLNFLNSLKRTVKRDYRHKTVANYDVVWNSAFELSEKDEAAIEEMHVRANQGKLDYMSIDEVRAEEGLDPLPNGEGESITPKGLQLFNEKGVPNDPKNPNAEGKEQQAMNEADKYLIIDLKAKQHARTKPPAGNPPNKP